ncbi:MAG: choice-of-anchor Q domain-containing protein, partial [Saprospiraceae bacterium]
MISSKTFAIGSLVIAAGLSYLYNSSFSHDVVQVEKSSTISSVAAGVQVYYVDSVATGANDGSNWANAFIELQDALLIADACDTIKVAEGTYFPTGTPPVPMPDRTVSFVIPESVVVLGGYGRGADSLIRNWVCNKVILSGDIDHNGDTLNNSYHVVQTINVDSTTIVDGFCITGGNANGNGIDNSGGGGWFNNGSGAGNLSNPTIINCVLYANAGVIGGAMFNKGFDLGRSKPIMINCLLTGNNANYGGAMSNRTFNDILDLNRGTSSPILINCVLSGNYARFSGGAMYNVGANPILTNCILWNNDANSGLGSGPVFENYEAIPKVGYSILQGISMNDVSVTGGVGMTMDNGFNKFVDPFFINAPSAGLSTAGNFHLLIASPAIDMGDNSVNNYPADLDGKVRIFNSTIDIGAYEFYINCDLYSGLTRIYVDSSAMGTNNGLTWDSAFTDLQDALAVVRSCGVDTILVAKGTYYPSDTLIIPNLCNDMVDIFEPNRSISFNIPESTVLLGGYPSGGQGLRNWVCNKTILSGDIDHNGDTLNNSYHVVQTIN